MSKNKTHKRKADQLRSVTIKPYPSRAPGSVVIEQGDTRVLCTASISEEPPKWLIDKATGKATRGWVTAEYNMLPGSTPDRKKRGPDSRATEIQRLISRCLRAGINLDQLPGVAITCDCDVLNADGGTRTASITGAFVALCQAIKHAKKIGLIPQNARPVRAIVAAVSVGIIDGKPMLDLDYPLDSRADVDMNVAMDSEGHYVEVQGTAEVATFNKAQLDAMLKLAQKGIRQLITVQRRVIR
ncbi:MAG: ribonuclease PH [Phycisphaera sp.]|nr:ribonuclease PH [Phycisphaera sp.]